MPASRCTALDAATSAEPLLSAMPHFGRGNLPPKSSKRALLGDLVKLGGLQMISLALPKN